MGSDIYEGRTELFFLLHLIGAAVFWDITKKRIPNWLIITGFFVGMIYQLWHFRWIGLVRFLFGAILPIILFWVLYYFRMIGAGDIKLLCTVGGFLGPAGGFQIILNTFLLGGVISSVLVLKRRNLFSRLSYFKSYLFQYLETRQWKPYRKAEDEDSHLYFSIPVFLSVLIYMIMTNGGVNRS